MWRHHRCIVHASGDRGDRGPSALDWAIMDGETRVGRDGARGERARWTPATSGRASNFPMRDATKSSLYRNEVTDAAVAALRLTLERMARGETPRAARLLATRKCAAGCGRRCGKPIARSTGARDDTATVLRKIRAADGSPGVLDDVLRRARVPVRRASRKVALREDFRARAR